jgi:hypothetical protein
VDRLFRRPCQIEEIRTAEPPRTLVLDTDAALLTGSGELHLDSQTVDAHIHGRPKHSTLTLHSAISVSGPLLRPHVGVDKRAALVQGGTALALGAVLTPLSAALAFIDPGLTHDADCRALLTQARNETGIHYRAHVSRNRSNFRGVNHVSATAASRLTAALRARFGTLPERSTAGCLLLGKHEIDLIGHPTTTLAVVVAAAFPEELRREHRIGRPFDYLLPPSQAGGELAVSVRPPHSVAAEGPFRSKTMVVGTILMGWTHPLFKRRH